MQRTTSLARRALVTLLAASTLGLAACGDDSGNDDAGADTPGSDAPAGEPIAADDWEARCAANEEAGKIVFLTGFQMAASPSIIGAIVADEQGYFEDMCLDVEIRAGEGSTNMALVSSGQAQLSGNSGFSNIAKVRAEGSDVVNVFTVGNTGLDGVMVMADSDITEPKDLEGKTIGYKGAPHTSYIAMLAAEGVDRSKITEVSVGYDPRILAEGGQLDALMVWVSNEPLTMQREGYDVRVIKNSDYGVVSTFGSIMANGKFAAEHPTAVEDFLRAQIKGLEWAEEHPEEAVSFAAARSEVDYDTVAELARFEAEIGLARESQIEGTGLGWPDPEKVVADLELAVEVGVLDAMPDDPGAISNPAFVETIYDGDQLIWPDE